jgi:hypothetical protein
MSTDPASVGIDAAPRCPQCGRPGEFGYRCIDGAMRWFCADHRLAQLWADARMPSPLSSHNQGASTDDNAHQQADCAAAESDGRSLPNPLDGLPWDQPIAGLDRHLVLLPAERRARPTAVAADRRPHFDEAGRLIHPCRKCGRDAHFGFRMNLRAGELGEWSCTTCTPPVKHRS